MNWLNLLVLRKDKLSAICSAEQMFNVKWSSVLTFGLNLEFTPKLQVSHYLLSPVPMQRWANLAESISMDPRSFKKKVLIASLWINLGSLGLGMTDFKILFL